MKKRQEEKGSLVVEAALIMPYFLFFILFLIMFIKIALLQMALQSTVSEATKQLATHMYPAAIIYEKTRSSQVGQKVNGYLNEGKKISDKITKIEELTNQHSKVLPPMIVKFIDWEKSSRMNLQKIVLEQGDKVISEGFEPFLKSTFVDRKIIGEDQLDQLQVVKVVLPHLNGENAFFGIETEYRFRLPVPFISKEIFLRNQAYERVWIGKEGVMLANVEKNKQIPIKIISISPSPVQRGLHMSVVVSIPPNTRATIKIRYPSERVSQARGLTPKKSDANGRVRWSWLVSGNTNPGKAVLTISVGMQSLERTFEVITKDQKAEIFDRVRGAA